MNNEEALIQYSPSRMLTPVMDLALAKARLEQFQKFIKEYMVEGEDYGKIPGTPKPTLYKPGADKLCELYGLSDSYRVIDRLVDFDRGLFDYEIECTLMRDGMTIATGLGSCSSYEGKYRWRDSKPICPECGREAIIKGKEEYGGGWLCHQKKGGCAAKFSEDDERIVSQKIGQVENEDIATLKNTILKMAKKRAKVDACLAATRSSGVFTQDHGDDEGKKKPSIQQPQRQSQSTDGVISEAQAKRLFAIANQAKYAQNQTKAVLEACGYASSKDIQKKHYQVICEFIEGTPVEQIEAGLPALKKWIAEN